MPQEINPGAFTAAEVFAAQGEVFVASLFGRGWSEGEIYQRVNSWYPLLSGADIESVMERGYDFFERTHAAEPVTHPFSTDIGGIRYQPGGPQRSVTVVGHVVVVNVRGYPAAEGDFTCTIFLPLDYSEVDICAEAFAEHLMSGVFSPPVDHWYYEVVDVFRGFFIEYR